MMVALPAVELPKNLLPGLTISKKPSKDVTPPDAPLTVPPLLVMVASPAVAALKRLLKVVSPPNAPLTVAPLFVMVALPAVELLPKAVRPPDAPLIVPPLLVKVPLAAVEVSLKIVMPWSPPNWLLTVLPLLIKVPLAAVVLLLNSVAPPVEVPKTRPLLVKVPWPALEESEKSVQRASPPIPPPFMVKKVPLPAVALFLNNNPNVTPKGAATKFSVVPELFVIPVPLMVSVPWLAVTVKELAPGAKVMPSTVVFAEIEMAVVFEIAKVAVSADPLGTVAGVQFVAVFQSPETGLRCHVALPARTELETPIAATKQR